MNVSALLCSGLQGPRLLLQYSAASLYLLREGFWRQSYRCSTTDVRSPSAVCWEPGAGPQSANSDPDGCLACAQEQQGASLLLAGRLHRSYRPQLPNWARPFCAHMHHAAVLETAGSDDETAGSSSTSSSVNNSMQQSSRSTAAWLDQQRHRRQTQLQQQRHQQQHVGQLHHMAGHHQQQPSAQQQNRYQGHLHAPHGRRHATSRSQVDRFISEQLLSCKSLGMLRRIMIKHKSTMEPEHVADTVLCLQHLVRAARAARRVGGRGGFAYMHHATSQARSQPRVRAAGELNRSRARAAESDSHMEQLMAQMLGELGGMIWFNMGDMTGPDLSKLLYSWAMLEWHPEPELLADVQASFIAAAAGGGLQQQNQQQQYAGEQQWAELHVWEGPWMAAGLWGLLKLGEPCEGQVLQLLSQHWRQLAAYWTPQQMADIASALALTADEQTAASARSDSQRDEKLQQQLAQIVLGLCECMLVVLGPQEEGVTSEPEVPLPWPESMLIQLQTSLRYASVPAAQRAAAVTNEIAAAGTGSPSSVGAGAAQSVPMMVVHNTPQLAWRMLQALAAVGLNVSEPEDAGIGAMVAGLSAATKVPGGGNYSG